MNTTLKCLCRIVSFLGLVCALFCFWYIVQVAFSFFGSEPLNDTQPRFVAWYGAFSSMSALIAIGTVAGSIDLASLRVRGARTLTICSFLPVALIGVVGMSWLSPMGLSIAAASGVGLGGLMPMILTFLPVWAGLLWIHAFRRLPPPLPVMA